jgi:PAS domain S-box-containing protein
MTLVALLSTTLGTRVYHLLILLMIGVMAGIALTQWRYTRDHRRTLLATIGLLVLRVVLLIGEPRGPAVLAPVTSGLDVASLTLLGWTFVAPLLDHRSRRMYLAGGLGMTLLCAVVFLPGWRRTLARVPIREYVTFWQQTFWYAAGMLLTLGPALVSLNRPRQEREQLATSGFVLLSLGFTALCAGSLLPTVGWPETSAYTLIGVGRLIQVLSYPLFAIALYGSACQDMRAYRRELQGASRETLRQTQELLFFLETSRAGDELADLDTILRRVTESTVTALGADRCAVFLVHPDHPGTISLAAQCALLQQGGHECPQHSSSLADQPTLDYALKRRKPLTINASVNVPRLKTLYTLLGSQQTGPTIVQPLLCQRRVLGALVVGNDHSQREFAPGEGRLCRNIAAQLATAIENAWLYRDLKTRTRQLSDALQSQEDEIQRKAAILESMTEGVIVEDPDGQVVITNAAAERVLDIPRQQILGHSLEHVLSRVPATPQVDWNEIVHSEAPFDGVFELETGLVCIRAAPVLTPAGNHLGVMVILHDITKETEAERTKNELVTAISHEILTPLTAIRGYTEALSSDMVGPINLAQSQLLKIIANNTMRMVGLTENLIAVSQIDKGFLKLEYGETDLHLITQDIVISFQDQFEAHQLEVSLELDDGPPTIEADPARVRQILNNLVSNAVKFTYPGGHITIGARVMSDDGGQPAKHCSVWVSDTGIGIAPEEQPRIWRRFYRPPSPMTTECSGLGVGLSIVKSLVEAHGGRVWAESVPGVGSTFTMLLPIKQTHQASGQEEANTADES